MMGPAQVVNNQLNMEQEQEELVPEAVVLSAVFQKLGPEEAGRTDMASWVASDSERSVTEHL